MFDLMPFGRNEKNFLNMWDNLENNFFGGSWKNISPFRTDIIDKGDTYLLQAELPGMKKEDIKIDIHNDLLTIHTEHDHIQEEKKDNIIHRERQFGSFSRSFDISNIKAEEISASYHEGLLELTLPKKASEPSDHSRRIDIK